MDSGIVKIDDLISPEYNPRHITPEAMESLKTSINEFGYITPIIVNRHNNHIVGGNQRYEALKQLGHSEVEVIFINEPDINREKAINIRLNNLSGDWDIGKLDNIFNDLELTGFDLSLTGFQTDNLQPFQPVEPTSEIPVSETITSDLNTGLKPETNTHPQSGGGQINNPMGILRERYENEKNTGESGSLKRDFIMPPFSILRGTDNDWLTLKKELKAQINDNGQSRENKLYGRELGVSLFDPVLTLLILKWFLPTRNNCKIIDCFSGDSAVGFIAGTLGHEFTGIELREEQVKLNNNRMKNNLSKYICDDGCNVLNHIQPHTMDLFFSCPPYYNMEVYSDLKEDASNQKTYNDFIKIIDTAFSNTIKTLKNNRFAVIVASNVRDKKTGYYYPFVNDIISIFQKNGMGFYNDIILSDPLTTAGLRARNLFKNRKVVKVHQNVLVFYKGDTGKIKKDYGMEI